MNNKKNIIRTIKKIKRNIIYSPLLYNSYYSIHNLRKLSYVISYRKCGRTWVQTVLVHYIGRKKYGIYEPLDFSVNPIRDFKKFSKSNRRVVFLHDFVVPGLNSVPGREFELSPYGFNPCVFLIRDPRDVIVSHFYHMMDRVNIMSAKGHVTKLSPYLSIEDFVSLDSYGIKSIIEFYNLLAKYYEFNKKVNFFRYEDLKGGGSFDINIWEQMFTYLLDETIDRDILRWSLELNEFQNMKKRQKNHKKDEKQHYESKGRVRRGQIGSYKDELSKDTINYIDICIKEQLNDFYKAYKIKA